MFPYGESVTRQRAVASMDPYSGEETGSDWSSPTTLVLDSCAVWPGPTAEPLMDARDMVTSDYTIAAPYGSDVVSSDRLVIRGQVCKVVGRPFDWRSPLTGWEPGRIIQADLVEG